MFSDGFIWSESFLRNVWRTCFEGFLVRRFHSRVFFWTFPFRRLIDFFERKSFDYSEDFREFLYGRCPMEGCNRNVFIVSFLEWFFFASLNGRVRFGSYLSFLFVVGISSVCFRLCGEDRWTMMQRQGNSRLARRSLDALVYRWRMSVLHLGQWSAIPWRAFMSSICLAFRRHTTFVWPHNSFPLTCRNCIMSSRSHWLLIGQPMKENESGSCYCWLFFMHGLGFQNCPFDIFIDLVNNGLHILQVQNWSISPWIL